MRKLLVATAVLAALVGTPAFAADMAAPVYKAPPPAAPMFSWTGFYIGLNGGYGWGHDPVTFSAANRRLTSSAARSAAHHQSAARAIRRPDRYNCRLRRRRDDGLISYGQSWPNFAPFTPPPKRMADISRAAGSVSRRIAHCFTPPAAAMAASSTPRSSPPDHRGRLCASQYQPAGCWRRYRICLCCGWSGRIEYLTTISAPSVDWNSMTFPADPIHSSAETCGDISTPASTTASAAEPNRRRYFGNGASANAGALSFWF